MNTFNVSFQRHLPSVMLKDVVDEYTYREITFHDAGVIKKDMPCRHVNSIDFFIGKQYETTDIATQEVLPFVRSTIRGPRLQRKYTITIDQHFVCFSIRFKPTGIFRLFGIPMVNFVDDAINAEEVLPVDFRVINDKLSDARDLASCVAIVEPFLIELLRDADVSVSPYAAVLAAEINHLRLNKMTDFYAAIPQSTRQIERTFKNEVGVSPKTYFNLLRFENVLRAKVKVPNEKWSTIAYDLHYFDQMHLVRDFRKFLGIVPSVFDAASLAL
ncbi:helix-turn-helix domain-containing protein [Pseudochryseolinea flava]|uniref:HTH araC/xylS-type domain-containing protein n=1 Tax=Pseudochryseolinea flava TaxID=2059302 RepID=A0A364Y5R3_9BACT|nr:helix-turn-helix domain-containing protein [Pseudochryseolinea flava]RAW02293.1 hypothetical protein DQQ10_07090 [Pseudochryseolinea flava]